MPDPVIWPRALLRPRTTAINIAPATVAGAASLSGFRQAVSSPAGVWSITYGGLVVTSRNQRLTLRALAALVEGRSTPIVLPVFDREELRPIDPDAEADATHDDGSSFDDGSIYDGARVHVISTGALVRGATIVEFELIDGEMPEPGQHFSIANRLYRIKSIIGTSGAVRGVYVWPPLRDDVAEGATFEFDEPVCLVRLAEDKGLDLALEYGSHGFPSISFVEDPT